MTGSYGWNWQWEADRTAQIRGQQTSGGTWKDETCAWWKGCKDGEGKTKGTYAGDPLVFQIGYHLCIKNKEKNTNFADQAILHIYVVRVVQTHFSGDFLKFTKLWVEKTWF